MSAYLTGEVTMSEQTARQPTEKLTLRIPVALHEQARREARAARRSLNRYIIEAVEQRVSQSEPSEESQAGSVELLLREHGLISEPPGPEWEKYSAGAPLLSYKELWERLKGQRPLSEDIIAMRGEL